uniref:Uncharacterized protein n=1 Tax=Arundo donax TaxID=35708 RepID=A0A0A8YWL3_ARUDO
MPHRTRDSTPHIASDR